ncbi:YhdP family protein [uncultured Thiodictyon sp.]|uniref:YhdP family protein n=1 Tax=uncultured Thiodictyon sp. TaxID=1846217 RepID=UPI0025F95720|nr:YhdP family protein [uncultured Thiodictyon sp.]
MLHLTHRTIAWLLRLSLLGLVLLAVLTTALRLALPVADGYRDELAQALSEQLGYPLQVKTLTLRLAGWTPRLVLGDVVITWPQTGGALLRLRALELDLDPIASLVAGRPRVRSLTLVGARVAVHRTRDGKVSLVGLTALTPDDPNALAIFLRQGRLNITDGEALIIDDALGGAVVRLTRVRLRLHNDGAVHQLELLATPVAADAQRSDAGPDDAQLRLLADLRGDADDTRQWDGNLYLSLAGANLAALVPQTLLDPERVSSRSVHLDSWNQVHQGTLVESLNRVALRGVTLQPPAALAPLSLERLDGLVRVTPAADDWRIQVAQLGLAVDEALVSDLGLDLQLSADGAPRTLDLASTGLDLQAITRLIRAWPATAPPPVDQDLLAALNPRARVEQLAARVEFPPAGPPTWQATAQVRRLGLDRHARIPAITGLDARLRADQDGGDLQLESADLALDGRPLFDQPLHLNQLRADLTWRRGPTGGWHLASNTADLANADLSAQVRFTLDLPGPADPPDSGPFLDLRAGLTDANIAQTRHYLPVGILNPELTLWLTHALVSGRVPRGDLVLRGPLKHYPFREQQGRFELVLGYRDLVLNYQHGWPPIEGSSGELRFLTQGLDIRMDTGRIYQSALSQGRASIADLWTPHRLPIHGEGSGPFTDGLKILTETPLAQPLGVLGRSLEVDGRLKLVLDLDLPLFKGGIMGVDGHLSWPAPASLALKNTQVRLTALAGDLEFTGNTLHADNIRGQLWGRPATLAISTQDPGDATAATTRISAHSRTPAKTLTARFPSPFWGLTTGDLEWDLGVELRNSDLKEPALPLAYSLRSDLRGLAINLPTPLGKTAEQPRPLELNGALVPGRRMTIAGAAQPLAWNLALALAPARLERGQVTLGAARAAPPAQSPGLVIEGTLPELNLPAWSDWWDRSATALGLTTNQSAAAGAKPGTWGLSADLRIARLNLGGPVLSDARVQAAPATAGWDLRLTSREVAGQIALPDPAAAGQPQAPLTLDLERLDLKPLIPNGSDTESTPPASPGVPARRPTAMDLRVRELRWGEVGLGRLSLNLRPDSAGLRVSRIAFDGTGDTRVTGDAAWLDSPTGGHGQLALTLKSANAGPLLHALDYAPFLSPAAVDARLRLDWPGGFSAFSLARSTGRIELDVGPGRLLDVDPGVGRVLGFLNLGELRRRLSLDFTDLYQKGFVFERITGRIDVGAGQARLKTFAIDGPSGDISVSGFADLRGRTFDQTVTVEPSIGTSVALASGVAGGPVVGAAVYLVDRLTGGALDRLASYQYRMTGPWNKPELTPIGWEPFARGARPSLDNGANAKPPGTPDGTQERTRRSDRDAPSTPAAPGLRPVNRFFE